MSTTHLVNMSILFIGHVDGCAFRIDRIVRLQKKTCVKHGVSANHRVTITAGIGHDINQGLVDIDYTLPWRTRHRHRMLTISYL